MQCPTNETSPSFTVLGPTPSTAKVREVPLTALLSLAGVQGAAAALDDCEHGHADLRWAGLRAGEGRARHHVLHPAPDPLLGHHHHDQHRYSTVQYSTVQYSKA